MKTLIVYDGCYGSTETYARWMAERLPGAEARRVTEADLLEKYDTVIVGEPVYMERVFPSIRDFLEKNADALAKKITAAFVVCLDPDAKYYRGKMIGGMKYVMDLVACFKVPPAHATVFGGEMNPIKMSEEHKQAILKFYKVVLGEDRSEVPYISRMNKEAAWKFVEDLQRKIEQGPPQGARQDREGTVKNDEKQTNR